MDGGMPEHSKEGELTDKSRTETAVSSSVARAGSQIYESTELRKQKPEISSQIPAINSMDSSNENNETHCNKDSNSVFYSRAERQRPNGQIISRTFGVRNF